MRCCRDVWSKALYILTIGQEPAAGHTLPDVSGTEW